MKPARDFRFSCHPGTMKQEEFIARFRDVYEHSPWVAEQAWLRGLEAEHDTVAGLGALFREIVDNAGEQKLMVLVRVHPDLAGKAAMRGELTVESTSEQAGAGIDQCSEEEFEQFQQYNKAYREKFGFPFIMAVKGSNRQAILTAFGQRLRNGPDRELSQAIEEIHKIASFRLQQMVVQA